MHRLDLTDGEPRHHSLKGRPYLRVYFRCANAYQRVYRDPDGRGYLARCPKCSGTMRFSIGPEGSNQRSFEVSC